MSSNAHKPRMINMSNRHGKVKQKPNMIIDFSKNDFRTIKNIYKKRFLILITSFFNVLLRNYSETFI